MLDSSLNGYEVAYSQKELSDTILALAAGEIHAGSFAKDYWTPKIKYNINLRKQ